MDNTYQWMYHVLLGNIWWLPMKSLASLCDDTYARKRSDDLSCATRRTQYPTIQKFWPRSRSTHRVLPTMNVYYYRIFKNNYSNVLWMKTYTYSHCLWCGRCVDRLTSPAVMIHPSTGHSLESIDKTTINYCNSNTFNKTELPINW